MISEDKHIDFSPLLSSAQPITLDEMDSIKLMNRVDTKYVTSETMLLEILGRAFRAGYMVLETEGKRMNPYDSVYYDTDGLRMYRDHHNRRLVRQKVRTRVYLSSGSTFLEIKKKNNHGRTRKKRISIAPEAFTDFTGDPFGEYGSFLKSISGYSPDQLKPRLETFFRRITLVNPARTERLTIDTSVSFTNRDTGQERNLGPAVIIELKQDGRMPSEMKAILLSLRVKPVRVSKYCIGTVLTNPSAPDHRFKERIRTIEKTINQRII